MVVEEEESPMAWRWWKEGGLGGWAVGRLAVADGRRRGEESEGWSLGAAEWEYDQLAGNLPTECDAMGCRDLFAAPNRARQGAGWPASPARAPRTNWYPARLRPPRPPFVGIYPALWRPLGAVPAAGEPTGRSSKTPSQLA